jgi:hypothetical protein
MTDMMCNQNLSLHDYSFYSVRAQHDKYKYERTFDDKTSDVTAAYFVDWLYPLRLICTRVNNLLKEKITHVRKNASKKKKHRICVAM